LPRDEKYQPWAKVQVIVKERNKEWMPARDWTGFERKTICRDKQGEDFEEVVVVISNSEYTANNILDDSGATGAATETFIEVSALGCSNWIGTVDFKPTISGSSWSLAQAVVSGAALPRHWRPTATWSMRAPGRPGT
jgi:hypothetical protein